MPDREHDPFGPPKISTLVGCLHCQQVYESYLIEWRGETTADGRADGFWCCPIEGCDGKGFRFDILPIDHDWTDEDGERMWVDDEGEADSSDFEDDPPQKSQRDGEGEEVPY